MRIISENDLALFDMKKPVILTKSSTLNSSPICIGGVGGSGTRVVAEILQQLGFCLGNNTNKSLDNLGLPLNQIANKSLNLDRKLILIGDLIANFEKEMHSSCLSRDWAWKIPGSFYWLDYTTHYFSEMKYIHVIRNGLDMAYSANNNQALNWSGFFNMRITEPPTPKEKLEYWMKANTFALAKADKLLPKRNLVVSFDRMCKSPDSEVMNIANFLRRNYPIQKIKEVSSLIVKPHSINRFRKYDFKAELGEELIQKVRRFELSLDFYNQK